ncbi:hypothetical protein JCM14713_22360 [Desulfomicrobium salsuginis]
MLPSQPLAVELMTHLYIIHKDRTLQLVKNKLRKHARYDREEKTIVHVYPFASQPPSLFTERQYHEFVPERLDYRLALAVAANKSQLTFVGTPAVDWWHQTKQN